MISPKGKSNKENVLFPRFTILAATVNETNLSGNNFLKQHVNRGE